VVNWVSLNPINPVDVVRANGRLGLFLDLETNTITNYQALRFLCDLGGHPRSIDLTLWFLAKQPKATHQQLTDNLTYTGPDSRMRLLAEGLTLRALAPCILGQYVDFAPPLSEAVHGVVYSAPRAHHLGPSIYLNSFSNADPFQIPEISILQIRLCCQHNASNSELSPLEQSLFKHLAEYCSVDVTTDDYYERLALMRDVLVREFHAYLNTKELTLAHLIGIPRKQSTAPCDKEMLSSDFFVPADHWGTSGDWLWKKTDDVNPSTELVKIHRGPYTIKLLDKPLTANGPLQQLGFSNKALRSTCLSGKPDLNRPGWDYLLVDEIMVPDSHLKGKDDRNTSDPKWQLHEMFVDSKMSAPRPDGSSANTVATLALEDATHKHDLLRKHPTGKYVLSCRYQCAAIVS